MDEHDSDSRPPNDVNARRRQRLERRRRRLRGARASGRWRRGLIGGRSDAGAERAAFEGRRWSSRLLHLVGEVVANSSAGIVAAGLVAVWTIVGAVVGFPPWWQTILYSVTASVTFVMVFVIQHTQARQTSATQRKLDELLRADDAADNALIAVEEAPDDILQALADLNLADRAGACDEGVPT